ncbi:hypothetical protein SAMN05216232_3116 [Virgibacillus subterraneus]|uniref:Uncharacterized protein n=1 Tax=Virgibacillus subterraneus TaxID=621109 RepID=A0A1H9IAL7_9BACI|nr:hypothetical protein [Virgibacillus subterraneus]SEQ71592.1 hypothetical protein SAMN05216232_3116 [Virgibacillus subterraneus]
MDFNVNVLEYEINNYKAQTEKVANANCRFDNSPSTYQVKPKRRRSLNSFVRQLRKYKSFLTA